MRWLFSFLILGTESLPAWRITQPVRESANSLVNRRGKGVGDGSGVDEGSGVNVAGIEVGGSVEVGKRAGATVAVADWQAEVKRRNPKRRIFFIMPYITHLSGILFRTSVLGFNRYRFGTNRSLESIDGYLRVAISSSQKYFQ